MVGLIPTPPLHPLLAQKIYPFMSLPFPQENPLIIIFRLYIPQKARRGTGKWATRGGNNSQDAMRSRLIKTSNSLMWLLVKRQEGREGGKMGRAGC